MTSSNTTTLKLTFHGCGVKGGGVPSEITTEELEGQLVYQSKATKAVGLLLKPQTGSALVRFDGVDFEVTGSVVLPLTPVNKPTSLFGGSLKYDALAELQENDEYENGRGEKLKPAMQTDWPSGNYVETFGWGLTLNMETNKEIEIKA